MKKSVFAIVLAALLLVSAGAMAMTAGTYEAVAVTAIYDADGNYLFANRIPVTLDVAK